MPTDGGAVPKHPLRRAWLSAPRARAVGHVLLIAQIVLLLVAIAGTHGLIVATGPSSTDYISFYAAGRLAAQGNAALAYDRAVHYALEQVITEPGIDHKFFFYPPIFLLLCAPLSLLPYLISFVLFQAATLGGFLAIIRRVLPADDQFAGGIGLVLAYPALYWTVGLGQNAFLTAALFTAALLILDTRPFLAGLLFGAICYKPHFGLLVPVALAASGRWVAIAGASVAVMLLIGCSVAFFGADAWRAYLAAASGAGAVYETGRINLAGYITVFGGARLLGLPVGAAYAAQIAAGLGAALAVGWIWWARTALPIRAAALLSGTLLTVPMGLLYDLMLLLPAIIWLARTGQASGFLPAEKPFLAFAFVAPLVVLSAGMGLDIPLGPCASAGVLGFCVARTRLARRGTHSNRVLGQ